MKHEEKLKQELARIKSVKKWPKRLQKIINKKRADGIQRYSEASFCKDNNIPIASFNRHKNLERIPSKEVFEKIEAIFKKCRV